MQLMIKRSVTDIEIADLLTGALEGGSNYWIQNGGATETIGDAAELGGVYYPSYIKAPLSSRGSYTLDVNHPDDDHKTKTVKLNRAKIEKGLTLMAESHPQAFADFVTGDYDAETSDVFLQLAIFGDVIFG